MLIHSLPDADGSRCTLTVEEPQQWLRATWRGFVDSEEALRGADNYLKNLGGLRYAYLLNDNTGLHGPWFDSLEWLRRVWAPQAAQMGLRYIAHVVQADTMHDTISDATPDNCLFELQIFDNLDEAQEWLRSCQVREAALRPGPTAS
jgi:hypothetical protein